MTRIVSYNILAGGYNLQKSGSSTRRVQQLTRIIRSAQPDIVGVVEATHPSMQQRPWVVEEIAEELGMQLMMGADAAHKHDYQLALLTRLPIIHTKVHHWPGIINKAPLEVCVQEADGQQLTVLVTHLTAAFNRGRAGSHIRVREARAIVNILEPLRQQRSPHVLMGDFNSLAPGDAFKAHLLLRYITQLDARRRDPQPADGQPYLNVVVPPRLRFLKPVLRAIPRSGILSNIFDRAAALYAPRNVISIFRAAGYSDCYRSLHPHEWGFTCPAALPAGRIDYIFASPPLAKRLEMCAPITQGEGVPASHASDHLGLAAAFS